VRVAFEVLTLGFTFTAGVSSSPDNRVLLLRFDELLEDSHLKFRVQLRRRTERSSNPSFH